jgi:hypothetical protein
MRDVDCRYRQGVKLWGGTTGGLNKYTRVNRNQSVE